MKLDNASIDEILRLQEQMQITNNRLLLIAYAIDKQTISTFKHIQVALEISSDDLGEYFATFLKHDLTYKRDEQFFSKIVKAPDIEKKEKLEENDTALGSFTSGAIEIIDHLAELVKIKFKHTKKRLALLESKLMQGYTVEQCNMLNLYFYDDWSENVDMKQYLTIETLYNEKFLVRLETSQKAFLEFEKYKEAIKRICEYFAAAYASILHGHDFNATLEALKQRDILSAVGTKPQRAIVLWLDKGISEQEITDTIYYCIAQWSRNKELISKISLTKILDSRFPERAEVVFKNKQLAEGKISLSSKKNAGFDDWKYEN